MNKKCDRTYYLMNPLTPYHSVVKRDKQKEQVKKIKKIETEEKHLFQNKNEKQATLNTILPDYLDVIDAEEN